MESRTPSFPEEPQENLPGGKGQRDPANESRRTRSYPEKPPKPAGIMEAFRINRQAPLPWTRAIGTGASWAIPILVGTWTGHYFYGLLAGMGAMAYLFAGDEPYGRRAVKLLIAMVGMAVCFGAGAWSSAASFWSAAFVLGLIGIGSVILCDAIHVPPFAALFFIFLCAIGTGMPVADPASLLQRVTLVFVGGIPAWLIAMSGWLFHPHGPEARAVAGTYRALAGLLAAVGTEQLLERQHQAAMAMRASEQVLSTVLPGRRRSTYRRLLRLNQQADAVFSAVIQLTAVSSDPVDPQLTTAVRALANALPDTEPVRSLTVPKPAHNVAAVEHLYGEVATAVAIAADQGPDPALVSSVKAPRQSTLGALAGAFDPTHPVVQGALRLGCTLVVAHVTAYIWRAQRPYWVVLSTAAVMLGPSVTATLHRAVQRTAGTIAGALLGVGLLYLHPSGVLIALAVMVSQVLAQLTLVRNYGFLVAFITPLAFLIAHSAHLEMTTNYLVTARLVDILLGSALGVAGSMLLGGRSASNRLPAVLSDALRRGRRLVQSLLTGQRKAAEKDRHLLRTALIDVRTAYHTAVDELVRDRPRLEPLWPAVIVIQRLGWFLNAVSHGQRLLISKDSLAQLHGFFDTLVSAVEDDRPLTPENTPVLPEYPVITQELHDISQRWRG